MGKENGRPEFGPNPAAPWPELAGVVRSTDLGHESKNQKHRDVENLTAISPRAKTVSWGGLSAAATENGGWRSRQKFGEVKRSVERTKS